MSSATEPAKEQATGQRDPAATSRWWWPFGGPAKPRTQQSADPAAPHAGQQDAATPVQEATAHAVKDRGYRTLLSPQSERDLPPADRRALLLEVYEAYLTNPLAHAVIEVGTNFVLGGGVRVVAEDHRVQRIIDDFWQDADNRMDERIYALLTELALFGEQFVRFFVDPLTGRTVVRQLDPLYVTEIETDPEDVERPLRYRYAPPPAGAPGPLPADETWICGGRDRSRGGEQGQQRDAGPLGPVHVIAVAAPLQGLADGSRADQPLQRGLSVRRDDRGSIAGRPGAETGPDGPSAGAGHRAVSQRIRAVAGGQPADRRRRRSQRRAGTQADDRGRGGRAGALPGRRRARQPRNGGGNGPTGAQTLPATTGVSAAAVGPHRAPRHSARVRAGALGPRINQAFRVEFDELSDTERSVELGRAAATFTTALGAAVDRGWLESEQARRLLLRFLGEAAPERMERRG